MTRLSHRYTAPMLLNEDSAQWGTDDVTDDDIWFLLTLDSNTRCGYWRSWHILQLCMFMGYLFHMPAQGTAEHSICTSMYPCGKMLVLHLRIRIPLSILYWITYSFSDSICMCVCWSRKMESQIENSVTLGAQWYFAQLSNYLMVGVSHHVENDHAEVTNHNSPENKI